MITKLAFLSRAFPGLFHRLPTIVSGGYAMPNGRFFLAGASVSAALHAAVFFGIPGPTPIKPPIEIGEIKGGDVWRPVVLEETELPKPELIAKVDDSATKAADTDKGSDYSRLPDRMGPPDLDGIHLTVDRYDPGKMVGGPVRWEAPSGPPTAGVANGLGPILRPDELDKQPEAANSASPRYPSDMRRNGVEGTVVLRFVVDSRGNVADAVVVSADYAEFGRAALDAILRWKFRPGMKNGRRVNVLMEMPMVFSLDTRT